jgi:hypothetical protein
MGLLEAFQDACKEFPAFRAAVVKARDLAADAGTRQQLDHLLNSLDQSYAEFQETFPRAVDEVQGRFQQARETAAQTQQTLAQAKEEIAKQKATAKTPPAEAASLPAPPPLPTMAPIDLAVGLRLRDELLKRFGGLRPRRDRSDEDREIWQDWEGEAPG